MFLAVPFSQANAALIFLFYYPVSLLSGYLPASLLLTFPVLGLQNKMYLSHRDSLSSLLGKSKVFLKP